MEKQELLVIIVDDKAIAIEHEGYDRPLLQQNPKNQQELEEVIQYKMNVQGKDSFYECYNNYETSLLWQKVHDRFKILDARNPQPVAKANLLQTLALRKLLEVKESEYYYAAMPEILKPFKDERFYLVEASREQNHGMYLIFLEKEEEEMPVLYYYSLTETNIAWEAEDLRFSLLKNMLMDQLRIIV